MDIGSTLGRYQLVEELGAGGMAAVYRARDGELRREVALKVMFPHLSRRREAVARFQREARAAAALDHPGIVRVYDVGGGEAPAEAGGDGAVDPPYLVMELVPGRSLGEHVAAHGPFLGEVVACVGVVLCAALGEAHRAGIIHRDVKPANVMVADSGRVALTDFGVARIEDDDSSLVTRSGMLLGTPAFMSPEQAMGDALDERSDIYSLGATLYQLATGSLPYAGATARVMTAIAEGSLVAPLQRNPAMGTALARIIERMMAQEPARRYQSADEAAAALRAVVTKGLGGGGPGEAAGGSPGKAAGGSSGKAPDGTAGRAGGEPGAVSPEAELKRFFADPAAYTREAVPRVVAASLRQARQAARERRLPRAIALADRALALDANCQEALALVQRLSTGQRRRHWIAGACALLVVSGAAAGLVAWRAQGTPGETAALAVADGGTPALALASSVDAGLPNLAGGPAPEGQVTGIEEETKWLAPRAGTDAKPETKRLAPRTGTDAKPETKRLAPRKGHDTKRLAPRNTDTKRPDTKRLAPRHEADTKPDTKRLAPRKETGTETESGTGTETESGTGTGTGSATGTAVEAGPAPARLSVDIKPWCDLRIDGTDHGRARRDRVIALPPGRHELTCSQGPGRAAWRETVTLSPGERRHLTGSVLQPVRIRIAVRRGDTVLIDTRPHQNGDTLTLTPGRHRVTVLAGGQEVASAWVAIPAVSACTVRDQPALDCYR